MTAKIKICGLTTASDAELAVHSGADYLGVIFAPASQRCVSLEIARDIFFVKQNAQLVGVFQNQPIKTVLEAYKAVPFDLIQLHGEEPPDYCVAMPAPVIKVFTTNLALTWDRISPYRAAVKYFMIDKPKSKSTADYFEQSLAFVFAEKAKLPPVFIAGKLTRDTVTAVLTAAHPFGVDVASGVELSPGVKDPQKLIAFCDAVKGVQF